MKMHPKPMVRHTQAVTAVRIEPRVATDLHPEPYHIRFEFPAHHQSSKARTTQVLTMMRDEAVTLFETLGVMLRFEGAKAAEIDTDHWADCHKDIRRAITPVERD